MTDNEIINALECCAERISCDQHCPYWRNSKGCDYVKVKVILDLINRQKAEINFAKHINGKTVGKLLSDYEELQNLIQNAKAEAVKEFAERLKSSAQTGKSPLLGIPYYHIPCEVFDNIVKEMVGED